MSASAQAQVPSTFAALFGIHHFTVKAQAQASYGAGAPFNYSVFQGDPHAGDPELLLNGDTQVTSSTGSQADVHSNNNLLLNGNPSVEGSCGGNPSATVNGNSSDSCQGGLIAPAPEISMPQWTISEATPPGATVIGSPSNPVGDTISGNTTLNGNYVIYGNLMIQGNSMVLGHYLVEDGSIIVNGNATMQGSFTVFGGGIYLGGDVTQSQGGSLALTAFTANRQIAANATTPKPHNPPSPGSIVLNGNIMVYSILYAPDSYIDLNGNITVNGAAVGYSDELNGNIAIQYNPVDITAVPVHQVALIQ